LANGKAVSRNYIALCLEYAAALIMNAPLSTTLWSGLLLLAAPRFSLFFYEHLLGPSFETAPQSSVIALTYLSLAALGIILFATRCKQRTPVLLIFATLALILQWQWSFFGWARLLLLFSAILISILVVEIFRQNRSLVRELKVQGDKPVALLLTSARLWSPLLLVLAGGIYANIQLSQWFDRAVYQATPIDRYCQISTPSRVSVVPCTDLDPEELIDRQKPLDFDQAVRLRLESLFLERGRELLRRASEEGLSARALAGELKPSRILNLGNEPDPAEALIRSDKKASELKKKLSKAQRAVHELKISKAGIPPVMRLVILQVYQKEKERRQNLVSRIERALSKRVSLLRKNAKDQEAASALGRTRQLQRRLALHLDRLRFSVRLPKPSEDQNVQLAFLIRALDQLEQRVTPEAVKVLKSAKEPDIVYSLLHMDRLCSVASLDETVLDAESKPSLKNKGEFACIREDQALLPQQSTDIGLKLSTDYSIDRWQIESERSGMRKLRELSRQNFRTGAEAAQALKDSGGVIPETIDLGRKDCHLVLRPGNCISNLAKHHTEATFFEIRSGAASDITDKIDGLQKASTESVDDQIVNARIHLYETLDATARSLKAAVERADQVAGVVSIVIAVLMVLATIKSFMYVLATRVFDTSGASRIDFEASSNAQGNYEAGSSFDIPRSFTEPLITKVTLDNQDNSKVLAPWPWAAPIGRIWHGAYFLFTRGSHFSDGAQPMHFSRANGQHIVKWNLVKGEEVIFNYRNFFGASANIELKTIVSLRLSTILLGRFIFHSARCTRGDGCLLLTVKGTVTDHQRTDSTPLERLIAWNKHTRFRVASAGTMKSVFFDGFTVVREKEENGEPSGLMVVEAIGDDRNVFSGAAQFIKTLFLPF
tara:strand:+ start:8985 stop:11645 length:2661 start_codon:yes stop_codon:yes gene_type:complete